MNDYQEKLKIAYSLQAEKKYSAAIEKFRECLDSDLLKVTALREVGKCHKMSGDTASALDFLEQALISDGTDNETLNEIYDIAMSLAETKRLRAIISDHVTSPTVAAYFNAKLFLLEGDVEAAREQLDFIIKNDNGSWEKKKLNADIKRAEGAFKDAAILYEKLLEEDPTSRMLLQEAAECCLNSDREDKAIEYYVSIVERYPGDLETVLRLFALYIKKGLIKEAESLKKHCLEEVQDVFQKDNLLNEFEILQKKKVLESKVKRLWVTVTMRCNIRCKTCGIWNHTWDLPYKTANEIIDMYPYLERIVWLGGEVFMYKHFEEMFEKASMYKNLTQQVITNGVILTDSWIEKLISAPNLELTFSVDGSTKEVYESIRVGASFDKLMDTIRKTMVLREQMAPNLKIRLNALIMKSNYHQLEDILDLAKKEGFDQITYLAVHFDKVPGENIFYDDKDSEIVSEIAAKMPLLRKKAEGYGMEIDILLPPDTFEFTDDPAGADFASGSLEKSASFISPERLQCEMPWKYLMVCDKGNVLMTGSCVKSVGSIYDNSISEIWNSEVSQEYRQNMIDGKYEGYCRTECISRW